jgi:hypothetical protein
MLEDKVEPLANTDPLPKPKYDFSKVNLTTGEGMQLGFDSWEEMDAYFDAYAEACEKAGINLDEQDDDKEPRNFWNYRVLEEIKYGISLFSIIEVHYEDGKISGYIDTHHNILSGWDTYDNLKGTWELVKGAFDRPIVRKDEKEFLYESEKKDEKNEFI